MRVIWLLIVALGLCGCGPSQPTQVGGKPVSYWVEALRGPDANLRKKAVAKLGNVGSADPAAWPAVVGALKDDDAQVRRAAIEAVLKFGSKSKETISQLTDMETNDPDDQVRAVAKKALGKIRRDFPGS
jgi:HEAT repeat protein